MRLKSLLLVHGAGSGPWVFDGWVEGFPHLRVVAPDLQQGLDVGGASMGDYTDRVVAEGRRLLKPLALCGWSMGGLVAMMAVPKLDPESLILIEASAPGEVQARCRVSMKGSNRVGVSLIAKRSMAPFHPAFGVV